ncbi:MULTISPECIES: phage terminase small subunit [unclassified Undibacterium]|uniref:phage terminase small subunit n=1 Tax=unclassified Undibacterium TaxID=2630295 RepID=UPI002AC94DE8|nr:MULTISPECIES: phage terminase small subunit [unclassified Undibacterium]MEB0138007.1 phage terminase small subunit [Undibacterium sp. CCC2.1]MEB0170660.1 phage terminase small subunit [Undibacterium sp. CCC1.1]MEB0177001.1 phage terminase small subunit [Undibacterium sp. CCC3.4]MEB0216289.1 phage terminase small subunit [Undibacterium sp. 5I2]WPX42475.1 phage terminase small subunit [Undibacterium sp. CCC3.4]
MARISPAQQHYLRTLAALAAANASAGGVVTGNAYELMCAQLITDRQRLKQIQSIERKIETKRALLPAYQDWIDGALASGHGAQDMVLTTLLVWHIDVGDFARALQIAEYVLQHNMKLPDQYQRDTATMLLDEIPDAFLQPPLPQGVDAMAILERVDQLTQGKDAPDQARAKLYKALGYACIAGSGEEDLTREQLPLAQEGLRHLQRALELFNGIGVKKDIERLERRIKKATPD